jgi:hypothetical protein
MKTLPQVQKRKGSGLGQGSGGRELAEQAQGLSSITNTTKKKRRYCQKRQEQR